jgi:hypothetical protein
VQSAGFLSPYELVSQHLAICWVQTPFILQSHSKIIGFDTYDHITSQTVPSSNSLGISYYGRTRSTVDSYSNFFHTVEHMLSAYPRGQIYSLGPSIGLRVISRTEVQMGIHDLMQYFPEHQNKWGSSIRHNTSYGLV